MTSGLFRESPLLGDGRRIARAVDHPHDHNLVLLRDVVDRVALMENHPQTRCELIAGGTEKGRLPQGFKLGLDCGDERVCNALRGFQREIGPDFRKIGFRRFG